MSRKHAANQSQELIGDLDNAVESFNTRHRFPYLLWPMWIVWLPLLIPPIMDFVRAQPGTLRLVTTLVGVGLFVALYIWATWKCVYELGSLSVPRVSTSRLKWLTVGCMILLSFCLALLAHLNSNWLDTFIFTGAYISGALPPRKALPAVGVTVVFSLLAGAFIGLSWFETIQSNIILIVTWVTTISLVRTFVAGRELSNAREEIARLAVTNERLRIARDLHDLLGHNLSLIALKSELARRLITVSPERATLEISDVEHVARTTLQEVREAVGRYRQLTLSGELHGAQEILAAAGIDCEIQGGQLADERLPTEIEAGLGWVMREGVTNVIRHSRAHHCRIRIGRDQSTVTVEITDDGPMVRTGSPSSDPRSSGDSGYGLRGLNERIIALGGYCEAGVGKEGGFRLVVNVPLSLQSARPGQLPAQTSIALAMDSETRKQGS